jgi:uncharacterized phage-associated protein
VEIPVLRDHSREKLLNAVAYFVQNTKACGKTKLYKLLYFLDFQHYTETGRSVTGLEYYAWPMGPVPRALHEELALPAQDFAAAFEVENLSLWNGNEMLKLRPLKPFDSSHFSKRELRILESLAGEFRTSTADQMVEATHLENLPWDQVYRKEGRPQELIPYELALRKGDKELVEGAIKEHEEFSENYGDRRDVPS